MLIKNILLILSPIFSVLFWMHFYLVKRPSERWRRKVSKFVPLLKLLNISTFVRLNRQHKETSCKTGLLTFSSSFFRVKVSKHFQFLFSFASVFCFYKLVLLCYITQIEDYVCCLPLLKSKSSDLFWHENFNFTFRRSSIYHDSEFCQSRFFKSIYIFRLLSKYGVKHFWSE
jgi:hypothetical protein